MEDKLIDDIKKATVLTNQKSLFADSSPDTLLINACVAYLKYKGYKTVAPIKSNYEVKTLDDLIEYFYILLSRSQHESKKIYRNTEKDRTTAKKFIQSRMNANGMNKKETLKECVEIIKTIFEHKKEFNFKYDMDFGMFGQVNLGWVTRKAIQILNKKIEEEMEEEIEKIHESMIKDHGEEDLGFQDLDELLENIRRKYDK